MAPQTPYYAALQGNWLVTGQSDSPGFPTPSQINYIGLTIVMKGNTVEARGKVFSFCAEGRGGGGFPILASSPIAPDGSFSLSAPGPISLGSIQISIQGLAPANGATSWSGTYSIFGNVSILNIPCTFNSGGSFTATSYPTFQGNFAGTLTASNTGSGPRPAFSVTLQASEGAPMFGLPGTQGTVEEVYMPLKGTVTVSGASCSITGTLDSTSIGFADEIDAHVPMSDGSTLILDGIFSDPTESILFPVILSDTNSQCVSSSAQGSLALQP